MTYIVPGQAVEVKDGQSHDEDEMAEFATHFPRWLFHVGFRVEVVGSSVQPVKVSVHVKLLEITELVHRVVL